MAKREKRRKLTINRGKWLTGEMVEAFEDRDQELKAKDSSKRCDVESVLLDSRTKMMCCLGFACRKVGVPARLIENQGMPGVVANRKGGKQFRAKLKAAGLVVPWAGAIKFNDSATASSLATVNDDGDKGRKDREHLVKEYFADIGWDVTFKGRYPNYKALAKRHERPR